MKGLFITFEGVEGCGKSTQVERLREWLEAQGRPVLVTREPGGVPIAEAIRAVLLQPDHDAMSPVTELLLYEAARAQLVHEFIRPALEAGQIVLCDRFADSTTAYQGMGRNLPPEDVVRLHALATQGIWPDLTFVLDLPVEEGLRRVRNRGRFDRMERQAVQFHERVREGFLAIAKSDPDRVKIIDATPPPDVVFKSVRADVESLLHRQ